MSETTRKLRVAIIGGGIGGLACAASLKNAMVELHLYEAAAQIAEVGVGIGIWQRTWLAMKEMGLEDDLLQCVQNKPSNERTLFWEYRKGDRLGCPPFFQVYREGGMFTFHRHELQQAILKNIPESCEVHLNHRLQSYTESENGVTLYFQNGQSAECDLLIGADGLKSVVRSGIPNHFRQGSTEPVWTGRTAYRTLISADALREVDPEHSTLTTPITYTGKNLHLITYPIRHGTAINFAAFHFDPSKEGTYLKEPAIRNATEEEVVKLFDGWPQQVQTVVKLAEKPSRWAIQALKPLDTYISNRVALLGDAAHAMPPHLGAGAGQAVEDGYILGKVITHLECTPERVPIVLKRYDEIRRPAGNKVLLDSLKQGAYYDLIAPWIDNVADISDEQYEQLADSINKGYLMAFDEEPLREAGRRAMRTSDN